MRKPRDLEKNVWYAVGTGLNIGEPLFQLPIAVVLLYRVLREAKKRFGFELRGLKIEGARLTFYIKPDDGLELPLIMQWMKQTFSARFNWLTGRSGHVWGDRYESEILEGEPPGWAKAVDWEAVNVEADKPIPADTTYTLTGAISFSGRLGGKDEVADRGTPETALLFGFKRQHIAEP
ncbi:MAG: hypothetical protein LBG27_01100 [Spirochaetaceae bacterium]|jgi:hypothetical protein|nr:hypothetical protein [Spirochaetaceae bacterium]